MPPRPAPQGVGRHVVGDRVQPGGELGLRLVALPGTIDPQKHLLGQVFGLLAVAHEVPQHRQQPALIAEHQFLEGGGVAIAHFEHQPDIGIQGVSAGGGFADDHGRPASREREPMTVGCGEPSVSEP